MNALYERYLPSIWRFVHARVDGDTHLAEDLVNETMLALFRSFSNPNSREIESLGGWLRTVANRKVQDHYRAVARVRHLVESAPDRHDLVAEAAPGSELEVARERRAEIREVMDSLSDPFRMALEWKYLDGLSVAEIAKRLGVTPKSAESTLYRARNAFRERAGIRDLAPTRSRITPGSNDAKMSIPLAKPGLTGGHLE